MSYIDETASLAALKHCRKAVVTASTDSLDFLHPINMGSCVSLEAFVTWTKKTSMEVIVKVKSEDLLSGEEKLCALSFLTFVALDDTNKPTEVPTVIPETEEEFWLNKTAEKRSEERMKRRENTKLFLEKLNKQ